MGVMLISKASLLSCLSFSFSVSNHSFESSFNNIFLVYVVYSTGKLLCHLIDEETKRRRHFPQALSKDQWLHDWHVHMHNLKSVLLTAGSVALLFLVCYKRKHIVWIVIENSIIGYCCHY